MPKPIRITISREAAARAKSRVWGDAFYEPEPEELAGLTADERKVLSVYEGEDKTEPRLRIFVLPMWVGICARVVCIERCDDSTMPDVLRARAEQEVQRWLSEPKPVLKLSGMRTEEAVRIATHFDAAIDNRFAASNWFVRRAANLVAALDLQLAHPLPPPLVVERDTFDAEFSFQPRIEPRLLQAAVHERVTARCAELAAWLPPSTVLEVGPVSRITTNDSKWTGVCVLVAHPGANVRMVVVFSAEVEE